MFLGTSWFLVVLSCRFPALNLFLSGLGVSFVSLFYTTFSAYQEAKKSSWRISFSVTLRLSQQLYLCNRRKLCSIAFLFWLMVAVQNFHLSAQIQILKGWRPGSLWFLFCFVLFCFQKNFNLLIFKACKKLLFVWQLFVNFIFRLRR